MKGRRMHEEFSMITLGLLYDKYATPQSVWGKEVSLVSHGVPAWIMSSGDNGRVTQEKLEDGFKRGASAYFAHAQAHIRA